MNTNRIQTIFYGGDHAEDTDRTGQGAGVSHNVISWRGNPVTTRCRHAAHRYNHRLPAARAAASSARITSDAVTLPPGPSTRGQSLSLSGQGERRGFVPQWYHRQHPLSFLAIHNCAISEDDTDAVTGICRRFQCVIVITDGAIIFISLTPAELFGQSFFDFGNSMPASTSLFSSAYFAVSPPVLVKPSSNPWRQGIPAEQGSAG